MTRPEFAVYRPPQRPTAGTYLRRLPRAVPLRKSRRTSQPTIETAFACNGYNLTAAKAPRNNASATFPDLPSYFPTIRRACGRYR
jgi:hypothetical protein